jgi:pyruvate dehydrogenase E1 component beta subunit
VIEFGKADVKRSGTDATLIAWSNMVPRCLAAAERLAGEGVNVEVVDPRTLVPLDKNTILESVRKTGRAVVVQEAVRRGGVASDIASLIQEEAFDYLDAPVRILAGINTTIPFNLNLEKACVPQAEEIVKAVKEILGKA